jgi:catechol 2,3-dioxygenase-like lactoylglutathione lyase family enzyme
MRYFKPMLIAVVVLATAILFNSFQSKEVSLNEARKMKVFSGIITDKLKESKEFYTKVLGFTVTFENDFFLLMESPSGEGRFSFLLPNHPSQQPIFQPAFEGKGAYITLEVEDADAEYKRIKATGTPIEIEIRDEEWGDRHFAIVDPNGIGIDIVKYTPPTENK